MLHLIVRPTPALALCLSTVVFDIATAADPLPQSRLTAEEFRWEISPRGNARTNVLGDDAKPGIYVNRTRFPPNTEIQPHVHPDNRIVTVISGTLHMGYGDPFDVNATKKMPAGSPWTEPVNQPHFVFTKDEEAVIQVVGSGPSGTTNSEAKQTTP